MLPTPPVPRPSRRTVLAGTAWAAPAVVVAAAAPALAASATAVMRIVPIGYNLTVDGLDLAHDVWNDGAGDTTDLTATVLVTAADATGWGASPLAVVLPSSQSRWSYAGVSGTGASRTFLFTNTVELMGGAGPRNFDVAVGSDAGTLGPGSFTVTMSPGGNGTAATYGPVAFAAGSSGGSGEPARSRVQPTA